MPPVKPDELVEYNDTAEIPFRPVWNSPVIGYSVERVSRSGQLKGSEFARKTVILNMPRSEDDAETWRISVIRSLVKQERTIRGAHHPHVIKLIQTYIYNQDGHGSRFAIIMDLADASLGQYLHHNQHINTQWFSCLLAGLRHFHALNIVHGAIKPTNILVKGGQVILTDIGCFSQRGVGVTIKNRSQINPVREYWAPEAVNIGEISKQGDIFSLGAVFLEMVLISYYPNESERLNSILKRPYPKDGILSYAKNVDEVHSFFGALVYEGDEFFSKSKEMIKNMIQYAKAQRPAAEDLLTLLPSCTCGEYKLVL